MPRKKKSDEVESSGQLCNWPGCGQPANFRAPLSRNSLHTYQWFCQEHITEFNKKWNYFEGMNTDEIYAFQRDATTGHRPTWRIDQNEKNRAAKLEEAFGRMFGDGPSGAYRADVPPTTARNRDALAALDLEHPSDKAKIKAHFRELAKKYHPDVNVGNKNAEETFKKITRAYQHLLAHYVES